MRLEQDDISVIKAVLLYILTHSDDENRDVYSIVKAAYYAQQSHLAKYGTPLFKDCICALPFGPVPSNIYNILKMSRGDFGAAGRHDLDDMRQASESIAFDNETFSAKEEPDMDFLSQSDVECLDGGIKKVAGMSFDQIKHDTHGKEWRRACKVPRKEMSVLNIAKEGNASEGALQYLRDYLETDQFSRQ